MNRPFVKMNGAGNDFVVVDTAVMPFRPSPQEVRAIADRVAGIGCDQLIAVERSDRADVFMRIWNSDGGEVEACGNAARCVAWLTMQACGRGKVWIDSVGGLLEARVAGEFLVAIDMGVPRLDWDEIPLRRKMDTRELDLTVNSILRGPGAVSMGNPHVVFFVPGANAAAIYEIGPRIEHDPMFPKGVNVGFAQIKARDHIRLMVWERGAGLTHACGTGACAALVAANRRGLTDRAATLEMDGGELYINWRESDDHVIMTGPVEVEFTGWLEPHMSAVGAQV